MSHFRKQHNQGFSPFMQEGVLNVSCFGKTKKIKPETNVKTKRSVLESHLCLTQNHGRSN